MVYSWQKLATLVVIMLSSQLAGCAYYSNNSRNCIDYLGRNTCETLELDPQEAMMSQPVYSSEGLRTQYSHKHLSHYVEQMTMKMIDKKSIESPYSLPAV